MQVRGNFVRLQTCISELRMLQVEGCHRPPHTLLPLAVEDGLQQFKQYSSHMATSTAQPCASLEITVLTSRPGKEVVKELEEGLKDINLLSVRRLQVVEITKGIQEQTDSPSPTEEPSNDESSILEADIVLETLDNDVVSMEVFFKAWLHNSETDQEDIHLLLTPQSLPPSPRAKDNPVCLKCDLQERFLSPSLLPGTADGLSRIDDPKGDISKLYQMPSLSSDSPYKLQVIKALKSSGICESLTYGLPFILRPTSCWQLDWDELETNQQHFHALCHCLLRFCLNAFTVKLHCEAFLLPSHLVPTHCLSSSTLVSVAASYLAIRVPLTAQKRDWLLLAKGEPLIPRHNQNPPACSVYVITPSHSLTLLVKLVATREMMLPGFFPLLSEDPPEDSLKIIESALDSLELRLSYNPLQVGSHLYSHLSSAHAKPQGRLHTSWASRVLRKGGSAADPQSSSRSGSPPNGSCPRESSEDASSQQSILSNLPAF
ncbi:Meiosis 1 arrest protein [Apodemus speciosus]|uniref:Meiosis 1 arrest protein n=1 Tax=Apodemus speciosus TaxID=105296 RepID=A0ABQ0EV95_APOSI